MSGPAALLLLAAAGSGAGPFHPLTERQWGEYVDAVVVLGDCVRGQRERRGVAETTAALDALGMTENIRRGALALVDGDPALQSRLRAASGPDAVGYSLQAVARREAARPMDRARLQAFVVYYEAMASAGTCVPSRTFLNYYESTTP